MPRAQVFSIGVHDLEKLPAVRMLNQPQLDLPINFVGKHGSKYPVYCQAVMLRRESAVAEELDVATVEVAVVVSEPLEP